MPLLLKFLNAEKRSSWPRRGAIRGLGKLKDVRAIPPLVEGIENSSESQDAMEALKQLGSAAEKSVLDLLNHKERIVRSRACEVLQVIGTRASIPALEQAAATDRSMTFPVERAIKAINARK